MATLPIPKGITPATVTNIPEEWSAEWFRSFIKNHLQYADVRNTIAGANVTVAGTPTTNATITATGGGTPGPNSITNAILAQAPGLSVKGNPLNTTANEQDIPASGGNQVLQSNAAGTALTWGPFGTGVQVRGATWVGGNASIVVGNMTDVSILNPIDMKVTRVSIMTKGGTGSCTCDVWTSPIAGYPPTAANTIFSTLPSITSGLSYDDIGLGGLSTTHIPAGNVLTFHLVSSSVFSEIVINLALTPTQTLVAGGYTDAQAVAAVKAAMTNVGNVIASGAVGAITLNESGVTGGSWSGTQANNGYQKFPNGLIIQWGQFTLPAAGAQSITFPITFPNAVFSCVPSQGDSTSYGYPFGVDSLTTSGFSTVSVAGGINAGTGYYIAIGN